ncbi:MAG: hypothetical protein GF308_22220 [Candidatus Heimdallarchaeota archaeon]|nr:hypothetical protein [Candidatus Heimdallarchaeota archaeon]
MKKRFIIPSFLMFIFIIGSYSLPIAVNGATWGVAPSSTYNFDLTNVDISLQIGSLYNYSANSITFGGGENVIPQGSQVIMTVTEVDSQNVSYELASGGLTENHELSNETFEDRIKELMLLPLKFAEEEIPIEEIMRGYTGLDYILVPTLNTTWDKFDVFDNPIYLSIMEQSYSSTGNAIDLQARTMVNYTQDQCIFDWYVAGNYSENSGTYFDIVYNLKTVYELSTGLLLGMRVDALVDGTYENQTTTGIIQSEVVRDGYSLGPFVLPGDEPEFSGFISGLIPGFHWYLVPVGFIILYGALVFIKRKSLKK